MPAFKSLGFSYWIVVWQEMFINPPHFLRSKMIHLPSFEIVANHIREFSHQSIDPTKTELLFDGRLREGSLAVRLFNTERNYVLQDVEITPEHHLPGLLLTFRPTERRIHIENIYVHPAYYGQRIGTEFVHHLMESARESRFARISLVADADTGAESYWRDIHDFSVPDESRPRFMEKRL